MVTIYISTNANQDLRDCGERNTEATRVEFGRAYNTAAQEMARAAGVEIVTDASGDESQAAGWRDRNRRAGLLVTETADDEGRDIPADVRQKLHDLVSSPRPGRWAANRKSAKAAGAALRRRLEKAGLLGE